jgi:Putative Actinobacterial Holin-X, holin superfamily III
MATVHPIRPREPVEPEGVIASLLRLARLELELGLAEARDLLISAVIAAAVAFVAAIALIASIVVLVAGALAPLFHAPWLHLVVAGGGLAMLSLAAIAWSVWRLRNLDWPKQTLTSFEENWRWLAAQLRSRLRLR